MARPFQDHLSRPTRALTASTGENNFYRKNVTLSRTGPQAGDNIWVDATLSRVLHILKNPRYAGMCFYGRTRQRPGTPSQTLPTDRWKVMIPNAHPGYITWEQYESHRQMLRENCPMARSNAVHLPPRKGLALLQGLTMCGRCGRRMTLRYSKPCRRKVSITYVCQHESKEHGQRLCQHVPGNAVDQAVSQATIQALTPEAINAALEVHAELQRRNAEVAALYQIQVDLPVA